MTATLRIRRLFRMRLNGATNQLQLSQDAAIQGEMRNLPE
jgi:hypothetical protein